METCLSRRNFVAAAAAGIAAAGIGTQVALADEAEAADEAEEVEEAAAEEEESEPIWDTSLMTFNGGELTSTEQHATLDSYDWRTDQLTIIDIANAAKDVTDAEAEEILYNEPEITEDYVQEDGTVVPAVYIALRNRIHRIGQGVGSEVNDGAWDYLMTQFTEDEAAFYLKMPMYQYFNAEQAGAAAGITWQEAEEICSDLSYRGLLNRVTRAGVNFYHLLAFAHGMLEFQMDQYYNDGYLTEVFGMNGTDYGYQSRNQGSAMYYAIPARQDIVSDTEILPYNDWQTIIERNTVISVSPCQCRTFTPLRNDMEVGEWCDHPLETCIATGEQAQYYIDNGIGRQIDQEEAIEIIENGVEAGMVIQVMNTKQCDVICQCHGDCCAIMRGYISLEGDVENLKYVSNYQLDVDFDACIQCGSCAERCPMFTITMDEETGYPTVGNLCVRCGQCCTVCPVGARTLSAVPEEDRWELPEDMLDDYYTKAVERAKRGFIQDFGA